jgi:hypothetical protein
MLDAIAEGRVVEAPAIWPREVANASSGLVRRRKLAEEERQTALRWLRGLPVRVDQDMVSLAFTTLSELASPLREVAKRCGVRLWTWLAEVSLGGPDPAPRVHPEP